MALVRQREWIYPERIEDIKDVKEHLRKHYLQHFEESQARLEDFESLEIDTLTVSNWTVATSFKPSVDATVDLGATTYRFRHLYLSGNLTDDTNTLTIANAKSAYTHSGVAGGNSVHVSTAENTQWDTAYSNRVDTWGDGLQISSQTASIDYNTTNLKITSNELDTIQSIATGASPTFVDPRVERLYLEDTGGNHYLVLKSNEDLSASRTLNFIIGDAARTFTLSGDNKVATWEATTSINLRSNAELRFYDDGNYVGFEAPALSADCIWVLPTADGAAGEHMVSDGSKTLSWTTGAGTGNVSAASNFGTDNVMIRSDGTAKGCQHTGIGIDNNNNITGIGKIEIQDGTDGTSAKGIYMWQTTDTNWGIYMGQSGASKSLADGVACASLSGETAHHIRFRVDDGATNGFIWENSSEACLMSLEGDTGNVGILGNITLSSATSTITGGTKLTLAAGASGVVCEDKFSFGTPTILTIAGGAITITGSYHKVMAPGSPTDLNTINGGVAGQILILESNEDVTDIVVKDNAGNIQLEGNADCTLAVTRQKIYLFYDPTLSLWLEMSRFTG